MTSTSTITTLEEHILACQLSSWYPLFSQLAGNNALRRKKATMQTILLNVPNEFIDYLSSDGIYLPVGCSTSNLLSCTWKAKEQDEENEQQHENDTNPSFPQLTLAIDTAIQTLGGKVMPKLNWSSPKDAVWIHGGTMQCHTAGDVYLLLKASDFCAFDVHHALPLGPEHYQIQLGLRKWCNLYPSQEFRCFVRGKELIAISQRHDAQYFGHLVKEKETLKELILEFFDEIVQSRFPLSQYCMDVYVDQQEKVWILDFNVWDRRTDALLFDWPELEQMSTDHVLDFRIVETDKQVRADPLASYKAPIDIVPIASPQQGGNVGQEFTKEFAAFMKQCMRPSDMDDDGDGSSSNSSFSKEET